MPASGKSAAWDEIHIARMASDKLVEHWAVIDGLTMTRQRPHGGAEFLTA